MKKEITLEEFFLLKEYERDDFVDSLAFMLNAWEPSATMHINQILEFGCNIKKYNAVDSAIDLLSKINSLQIINCLRQRMDNRDESAIAMLLVAISKNYHLNYDLRFDTIEFYVGNSKYNFLKSKLVKDSFSQAFFYLQNELLSKCENLKNVLINLDDKELLDAYFWFREEE
jgi:hypothetical protein